MHKPCTVSPFHRALSTFSLDSQQNALLSKQVPAKALWSAANFVTLALDAYAIHQTHACVSIGSMAATSNELLLATEHGASCCPLSRLRDAPAEHGADSLAEPAESPLSPWHSITFPSAVQITKIAAGEAHRQAMSVWDAAKLHGEQSVCKSGTCHIVAYHGHEPLNRSLMLLPNASFLGFNRLLGLWGPSDMLPCNAATVQLSSQQQSLSTLLSSGLQSERCIGCHGHGRHLPHASSKALV